MRGTISHQSSRANVEIYTWLQILKGCPKTIPSCVAAREKAARSNKANQSLHAAMHDDGVLAGLLALSQGRNPRPQVPLAVTAQKRANRGTANPTGHPLLRQQFMLFRDIC